MLLNGYLQTAITQLQSALVGLQTEIHDMQREIDGQKQQLSTEAEHLNRERKVHEVEMVRVTDNNEQRLLLDRIRQLEHESEDKKGRTAELDNELKQAVQRKTQLHGKLQDLSRQLEMLLASPDLR